MMYSLVYPFQFLDDPSSFGRSPKSHNIQITVMDTCQWRIQDFPFGGDADLRRGRFSMKIHAIFWLRLRFFLKCVVHSQRLKITATKWVQNSLYRSDFFAVAAIFPRKVADGTKKSLTVNEA